MPLGMARDVKTYVPPASQVVVPGGRCVEVADGDEVADGEDVGDSSMVEEAEWVAAWEADTVAEREMREAKAVLVGLTALHWW